MKTPRCLPGLDPSGHLVYGESRLFPNLFPYGMYSAVSLFDNDHTGFELMLGDMATFTLPEEITDKARPFWTAG